MVRCAQSGECISAQVSHLSLSDGQPIRGESDLIHNAASLLLDEGGKSYPVVFLNFRGNCNIILVYICVHVFHSLCQLYSTDMDRGSKKNEQEARNGKKDDSRQVDKPDERKRKRLMEARETGGDIRQKVDKQQDEKRRKKVMEAKESDLKEMGKQQEERKRKKLMEAKVLREVWHTHS